MIVAVLVDVVVSVTVVVVAGLGSLGLGLGLAWMAAWPGWLAGLGGGYFLEIGAAVTQ